MLQKNHCIKPQLWLLCPWLVPDLKKGLGLGRRWLSCCRSVEIVQFGFSCCRLFWSLLSTIGDKRFARQYRYKPPSEFPLNIQPSGVNAKSVSIVHTLKKKRRSFI